MLFTIFVNYEQNSCFNPEYKLGGLVKNGYDCFETKISLKTLPFIREMLGQSSTRPLCSLLQNCLVLCRLAHKLTEE